MMLTAWKLNRTGKRLAPRRAFRSALRNRLCEAAPERFGRSAGIRGWRLAAGGVCAVVLVFGGGTGVYAYESQDVVEGSMLYPVKAGIERAQEAIARTPAAKAEVHAVMLERRVQEAERHEDDPPVRDRLLRAAASEIRASNRELRKELPDSQTHARVLRRVEAGSERYDKLLQRVERDD